MSQINGSRFGEGWLDEAFSLRLRRRISGPRDLLTPFWQSFGGPKAAKIQEQIVGDDIWEITIWPKDIFALNFAEQISMITYNFQDQNGNNIVRDFSTGEDFTMFASCQ